MNKKLIKNKKHKKIEKLKIFLTKYLIFLKNSFIRMILNVFFVARTFQIFMKNLTAIAVKNLSLLTKITPAKFVHCQ